MFEQEKTEKYHSNSSPLQPRFGSRELLKDRVHGKHILAHVDKHIGKVGWVLREPSAPENQIDILVVPPTPRRKIYTLVTCGLSDQAMHVPSGAEDYRFSELMLALPPEWPLNEKGLLDEENAWPLRWLNKIARMPREFDTWLAWSHCIPNGSTAEHYADNTKLCGMLVSLPYFEREDFLRLRIDPTTRIVFLTLIPAYREELDHRQHKGMEAIEERLFDNGVTHVVDPQRPNYIELGKKTDSMARRAKWSLC